MPIKRENKDRYPADWSTRIRPAILERANNRCEVCGVVNHSVGYRESDGTFMPAAGNQQHDAAGRGELSYGEALELVRHCRDWCDDNLIIIVLTIAHLDHTPENNDPANLKAMCQRCHNRYDQAHRQANAAATRKAKQRQQSLPL